MRYVAGDGLELEVRPREMTGPLPPSRRWGLRWIWLFYVMAALPLLAILVCVLVTAWYAARYRFLELPRNPELEPPDPVRSDAGFLILGTLVWLGCAVLLWVLGFVLAHATRAARHWSAPVVLILVLPFATSVLVAGVAWRSLVDPVQGRFPNPDLLATGWVWLILIAAFTWSWLGFAVSLIRAGLDAVEHNPAARESPGRRSLRERLSPPGLGTVAWLLLLTLLVASTRVFELVLITVPSGRQFEIGAPALHWWRMDVVNSDPGPAATIAMSLFLVAGALAAVAFALIRPDRPRWIEPAPAEPRLEEDTDTARGPFARVLAVAGAVVVAVIVLAPLGLLVWNAFSHTPTNTGNGPTLTSWAQLLEPGLEAGLGNSMLVTGVVATFATTTTVIAAIGLAYLLASNLPKRARQVLLVLLVLLTIAPVQSFVVPFRQAVENLGLGGTKIPLILLHVAVFLPYATLVLRGALEVPEHRGRSDMLFGLTGSTATVGRLAERIGAPLIAVFVLQWVLVWNDFLIGFLLDGPGASPVTVLLWGEARQFSVSIGPVSAGALLASLPPVLLVLLTWRRWVVPGLTRGLLR